MKSKSNTRAPAKMKQTPANTMSLVCSREDIKAGDEGESFDLNRNIFFCLGFCYVKTTCLSRDNGDRSTVGSEKMDRFFFNPFFFF